MQVSITGKQLDIGDSLREHVESRLTDAVEKYFDHAIEANVVLSRDAHRLKVDISVHVGRGILVQGHAHGDNAHTAFDSASDRVAKRLRRYKRRLRDHHRKQKTIEQDSVITAQQYVLATAIESDEDTDAPNQPIVVAELTTALERMTVGEAVMRLDLTEQTALMFHNSAHGGLNVVYRRGDGNFGWIDPQGNPIVQD